MLLTQTLACETVFAVLSGQNLTEALSITWRQNPNITPQQRGAVQKSQALFSCVVEPGE
jgi:16S rRNA (cytosine967-C5)-methyltransferase